MKDVEKIKWLTSYLKKNEYPIDELTLIGIRNPEKMDQDIINDYLGYFTKDEIFLVSGTTDPSVYWTTSKERNPAGAFHLMEGFHTGIWCVGTHKGYEALSNDFKYCKPTKGWRDADKNYIKGDKDKIVCDYFGVNFHRMHQSLIAKVIGRYSAGCQVIQNPNDFNKIMNKIKSTAMYKNSSKKTVFNYMLFDVNEVPSDFIK